jgi:hypothetical protein
MMMFGIFISGMIWGAGLIALFMNSEFMQRQRCWYDLDRKGREQVAEIRRRETQQKERLPFSR